MSILRRKFIIGPVMMAAKDLPPKEGNIRTKISIIPNRSKKLLNARAFSSGRIPVSIFPPSRGLIGMRLKTARTILNWIK